MVLLPIIAAVRILGRPLGLDATGTGVPSAPVNRVLTRLLAAESRWVSGRGLPGGVSLLAIAESGTAGEGSRS
jgi:hypothetical protein